jgi:hypothetical protein
MKNAHQLTLVYQTPIKYLALRIGQSMKHMKHQGENLWVKQDQHNKGQQTETYDAMAKSSTKNLL